MDVGQGLNWAVAQEGKKSGRMRWRGHVAGMGEKRILMVKTEGKIPLGISGHRSEDIKMYLREIR
jgi:hypothetical protein